MKQTHHSYKPPHGWGREAEWPGEGLISEATFFQIARYFVVGAVSTVADYGSYLFFTRGLALSAFDANPLAYLFGNAVSFFGHHFITFRSHGKPLPEYLRFIFVSIVGLGVSQAVIAATLGLGAPDLIAKAAAVFISGLFNYLCNRFWTFRPIVHRP